MDTCSKYKKRDDKRVVVQLYVFRISFIDTGEVYTRKAPRIIYGTHVYELLFAKYTIENTLDSEYSPRRRVPTAAIVSIRFRVESERARVCVCPLVLPLRTVCRRQWRSQGEGGGLRV